MIPAPFLYFIVMPMSRICMRWGLFRAYLPFLFFEELLCSLFPCIYKDQGGWGSGFLPWREPHFLAFPIMPFCLTLSGRSVRDEGFFLSYIFYAHVFKALISQLSFPSRNTLCYNSSNPLLTLPWSNIHISVHRFSSILFPLLSLFCLQYWSIHYMFSFLFPPSFDCSILTPLYTLREKIRKEYHESFYLDHSTDPDSFFDAQIQLVVE